MVICHHQQPSENEELLS